MARTPFQVLVFLHFCVADGSPRYALFRRADMGVWQAIAGGGEGAVTPALAALREAAEEAGVPPETPLLALATEGRVPVTEFSDRAGWPADLLSIPEYTFAMAVDPVKVRLSAEHDAIEWLDHAEAVERLEWQSNRAALAELHARLVGGGVP